MRSPKVTREAMLEAGMLVSLALVVGAFGMLALYRQVGSARRAERHRQPQPEPGRIPATRHQQIAVTTGR